jgi:multiple sugar transport system ATP-binding protein
VADVALLAVNKWYGDFHAVNDLNLAISDREFMVILGPSGSGKTTALRMIAGLEPIDSGEIRIGGRQVNALQPKDRDIAMVFQNYALFAHMTVAENIGFGLRMAKAPEAEVKRRVLEVAELLGLERWLTARPRHLSGGMQQRVALGRAIARNASLYLMDEPLSNLDALLRVKTRTEVIKLARSLQTTVIYVTHDQTEAMTMAHRIAIMKDGILQQVGAPLDVYRTPHNRFVAGFIGMPQMNFFEGSRLRRDGHRLSVDTPSFSIPLDRGVVAPSDMGDEVVLGVRPEHVRLANSDMAPTVEAVVDVVEPLGAHTLVYLRAGAMPLSMLVDGHIELVPGQAVPLTMSHEAVHLFHPVTGTAVHSRALEEVAR